MTDDTIIANAIATHTPERRGVKGDWDDVVERVDQLSRSDYGHAPRTPAIQSSRTSAWHHIVGNRRRRLALAAAVVVGAATSTIAVASRDGWWFLRSGGPPQPTSEVAIVSEGRWFDRTWTLIAYRTAADELCYGVMPTTVGDRAAQRGALACVRISRLSARDDSARTNGQGIAALAVGEEPDFPAHVVGVVTSEAKNVELRLGGGKSIKLKVSTPLDRLGLWVGTYAAALPCGLSADEAVALDTEGRAIARVRLPALPPARGGVSTRCR